MSPVLMRCVVSVVVVPDTIEKTLADSGLPKIATRDVPEEIGFRLVLKGKTYSFPFDCAPPEGYLTVDYSA
ncbi:hypothetical protein R3P38DRAFT_3531439 [Favolaschia claudopus]|uniref:Uncharacterized protein n=1 Tax=Favolaschia claudopus TaxID=2862362 RepID=A0AAW0BH60_9AGAR